MTLDHTQQQGADEQLRAQQLSLQRTSPPTEVPGYEPQRFLGAGAYGEVWVALDRTTGRQVAIKFYAHRGGLDWSLLSREVEKLAFLSADRYVVQLLDVGWDADPPYYVMEYIQHGSLDERIKAGGPLKVDEAVALCTDVAIGLVHAHGKGVLHCDLKPANVLLDEDNKPRLADFGQSRLSHEQTPALGTLFYMAPEQADLKAVPDARWDVYALGAVLYCMLTAAPPHRRDEAVTEIEKAKDLEERLARYRNLLRNAPRPDGHRKVRGVDRPLAEIIDRCLVVNPANRFPNVQAVLDALESRARRRARRPLMVLGAIGPVLLLAVVGFVAWQWFRTVVGHSNEALTERALSNNSFAAQNVAMAAGNELDRRYGAVERVATDPGFREILRQTLNHPDLTTLRKELNDPNLAEDALEPLREQFQEHPGRKDLQGLTEALEKADEWGAASWFVNDASGLQLARGPRSGTIGRNFGWRTYFHGGAEDFAENWRPKSNQRIRETTLSAVFRSLATNNWIVAISTPINQRTMGSDGEAVNTFLGTVTMTIDVNKLMEMRGGEEQFAVLVDWRNGPNKGLILQHPLFDKLIEKEGRLPDRFKDFRVSQDDLPVTQEIRQDYRDPVAKDPSGGDYEKHWLANVSPVTVRTADTGWEVIVQESYEAAIGRTLKELQDSLVFFAVLALALVAIVVTALWIFVVRILNSSAASVASTVSTTHSSSENGQFSDVRRRQTVKGS